MEVAKVNWANYCDEADKPVVAEMRKRLAAEGRSVGRHDYDAYLARFSRARKRDVDKAYKMLIECLDWRAEMKVDTLYEWWEKDPEFSKMLQYYPYDGSVMEGRGGPSYGVGKGGRPVHLDHYPLIEPTTVLHSFSHETMVLNHIWVMEKSLDLAVVQSEKEGKAITDQIFFFNMTGLGIRHLHGDVMDSVKECFTIDENFYPELVHVVLVINAPRIFTLLFKLVSPFVDPDTLAKTKILGAEWMDEALKFVEPENLPAEWGGKGPKWFRTAGGFVLAGEGQQQQQVEVQVAARNQTTVPFKVEGDLYQLAYEFSSVDYDVEFGIVMLGEGEKQIVVEKVKRYDSHLEPVQGIVTKLKAGSYLLVFNNAYSWTTDKQIKLSYYVSAPPAKMSKSQKKREKAKRKKEAAKAAK